MKKIGLLSLFVLASTALTACSLAGVRSLVKDNEGRQEKQLPLGMEIGGRKGVDDYINNAQEEKWYDEGKVLEHQLEEISFDPVTTEDDQGSKIIVTHKEQKHLASDDSPLTNIQANDRIFPGALIIPDNQLMSASPTIMSIGRGEMPFSIVLDGSGLRDSNFTVVPDNRSKVHSEVQNRLFTWKADHSRTAQNVSDLEQVFSRNQIDTKFGIGVGSSLNIDAEYETTATKNTFIATYTDVFYSVGVEMADQGTIFANNVTVDDVKSHTEVDDKYYPPLLVTNCKYGRIIYLKIETELNKEQVKTGLEYAGSVDIEQQNKFNETFKNSSISCMCYGGSQQNFVQWFAEDNLASKIAGVFSKNSEVKDDILNAALLSYSCNFIDHNMKYAGVFSSTDYIETTYTTLKEQVVEVHNHAAFTIDCLGFWGSEIVGWTDKGEPIYEEMKPHGKEGYLYYTSSNMSYNKPKKVYHFSPKCARMKFRYDIWDNLKNYVYNDRIDPYNNWFEKAVIVVDGDVFEPELKITINDTTTYYY